MRWCKKKKKLRNGNHKGGTGSNSSGFYFAVDAPKIERLPQYRAYRSHNTPIFLGENFNYYEKKCYRSDELQSCYWRDWKVTSCKRS